MKNKWVVFFLVGLAIIAWLPYQYKKIQAEKDFTDYLLIRETGIYTLLGSKPITSFLVSHKEVKDSTPREITPIFGLQFSKSNHFEKEPSDLWKSWKKSHPINSGHFSLVSFQKASSEELFLVNKDSVRKALKTHYSKITEHIGEDFNINDVLNTIQYPDSYFWENIFNNALTCGIFYGYGAENAEKFKTEDPNSKFSNPISDMLNARFKKNVSLLDLPLPMFKSFSDPDPMIEKYTQEREQLQKQYANADLRKLLIQAFLH